MKIKRGVVLAVAGSLAVGYFWGVLSLRLMVFPYPQIRSVLAATGLYRPIAAGGGYAKSPVKRPSRGCGPCILLRAVVFLWVSAEACVGVLPMYCRFLEISESGLWRGRATSLGC